MTDDKEQTALPKCDLRNIQKRMPASVRETYVIEKPRIVYIPSTMENAEVHQKAWAKHGVEIRLMEFVEDEHDNT